jgi:hypothetical protein
MRRRYSNLRPRSGCRRHRESTSSPHAKSPTSRSAYPAAHFLQRIDKASGDELLTHIELKSVSHYGYEVLGDRLGRQFFDRAPERNNPQI